ncbi:MAG: aquaporin [Gammaproteobacteria bacterium]
MNAIGIDQSCGWMKRGWHSLCRHWPEYLMEAWGLGLFMTSAGLFVILMEWPGSPIHQALPHPLARRALMGSAMGLTAIALIYSPWGQQSGAHLNPATTIAFLRLGKVKPWDALFYIIAQFCGGTLGVLLVANVAGTVFSTPPIHYAATQPGHYGPWAAWVAEFMIALGMMLMVLTLSNTPRFARLTGVGAGILVALYITLEAPISGMSMNPARSFASAAPAGIWHSLWIYFSAPPLGMLSAVEIYRRLASRPLLSCAKLDHPVHKRCIHCGHQPPS